MNKSQLIQLLVDQRDMKKKEAALVVETIFDAMGSTLKDGGKVSIPDFGSFEVRERSARKGRNPQTGEEMQIAASKIPAFKPAKKLKEAVKDTRVG